MRIAIFAGCLLLCGCVTTEPQSIGRDTFVVETLGTNMTFGPSLRSATAFCAKQNKLVQVMRTDKGGMGPGANTSLTFMCLAENDPRYHSPTMRPDHGVTTVENH